MLEDGSEVKRLVGRYNVQGRLGEALRAGVAQRERDWAVERGLYSVVGLSGGATSEAAEWGAWRGEGSSSGVGYYRGRMESVMKQFCGEVIGSGGELVRLVASDGSGGGGAGVGVVVASAGDVSALSGGGFERVDNIQVLGSSGGRLPNAMGTVEADNQIAEDVGGGKALMACIQTGALMVIVDNAQTVLDMVRSGREERVTPREAMRHRCGPASYVIR